MLTKRCYVLSRCKLPLCLLLLSLCVLVQLPVFAEQITFAIGTNPSRQAFLDAYMGYINQTYPDLRVTYVSGSSSKVLTMVAGGIPPELQRIGMETYQEFAESGILQDITPLIERDGVRLEDFFPAFAKALVYGGGIYALPTNVNPTVMYWNPALFAAHGVVPPPTRYGDPAWTWAKIREISRKFTRDTNGDGIPDQWGVAGNPRSEVTRIGSAWGARFMDDNFKFCGNTPEMTTALQFFADWILADNTLTVNTAPFGQGRAAIKLGDTAATLPEYHSKGAEFRVAPVPTGHIPDLYAAGIRFFVGSNVESAWRFVKPMVFEPKWVVDKAIAYGGLPSLRGAMSLYRKQVPYLDDGSWNVLLDMLTVGEIRGMDLGPLRGDVGAVIQEEVAAVLEGRIPPEVALQNMGRAINAILN